MADELYERLSCGGCAAGLFSGLVEARKTGWGGARPGAGRPKGSRKSTKPQPEVKVCKVCGDQFTRGRSHCEQCSSKLRLAKRRTGCDHPKPLFANGKPRKVCLDCAPKPIPRSRKPTAFKPCGPAICARQACGVEFVPRFILVRYCSPECKKASAREQLAARGQKRTALKHAAGMTKPLEQWRAEVKNASHKATCEHCAKKFKPNLSGSNAKRGYLPRWCSWACRKAANAIIREHVKLARVPPPKFSTYYAAHCKACGAASGGRREWKVCRECRKASSRQAGQQAREALHKAAAVETACPDCGVRFCRLFGYHFYACLDCYEERARETKRVARAARRARVRAVTVEKVSPRKVFARDGYLCYLCSCETPWRLRGTYEPKAPEVEHVIPVSKGGPHSYANTRCSCRACNLDKGDDLLADYLARRQAESMIPV